MAQQPTTPNQSSTVPNQSWDALRQLQTGEKLKVERKAGKKRGSGELVSVSDTELVIERKGKTVSLWRDEVKKVWLVVLPRGNARKIFSIIQWGSAGFAVGAITVFLIALDTCHDGCNEAGMYAGLVGATAVGGLIGYFTERDRLTLIYSAP